MRLIKRVAFLAVMALVLSHPLAVRAVPVGCFDSEASGWCEDNGPANGYSCDYGFCEGSQSSCQAQANTSCLSAANYACADFYTGQVESNGDGWEIYCDVDCGQRGGPQACL